MSVARIAFVLIAVGAIMFTGLGAVEAEYFDAVRDTGEENTVVDENITADVGSVNYLSKSNETNLVFNETVIVEEEQGGTNKTVEPSEYDWRQGSGELFIPNDSEITDGSTLYVTYGYFSPTDEQLYARDIGSWAFSLGDGMMVALAALLLLGALGLLGRAA